MIYSIAVYNFGSMVYERMRKIWPVMMSSWFARTPQMFFLGQAWDTFMTVESEQFTRFSFYIHVTLTSVG